MTEKTLKDVLPLYEARFQDNINFDQFWTEEAAVAAMLVKMLGRLVA